MSLLCALGFHDKQVEHFWTPSIHAEIVTEYKMEIHCRRCKLLLKQDILRWNADKLEMEEA